MSTYEEIKAMIEATKEDFRKLEEKVAEVFKRIPEDNVVEIKSHSIAPPEGKLIGQ